MAELIAQLTDLHVQVGPGDAVAAQRVSEAIGLLSRLEPAPSLVLLTGDLVNTGTPAEYERLGTVLAPLVELGIPLQPLVGNHDDRALLRDAFEGIPQGAALGSEGFVQSEARAAGVRVLGLDTQREGRDDGELDDDRLAWLEQRLAEAPDAPTILAMHHPPAPIGLPNLDAIALRPDDATRLAKLVARHRQVVRIVAGHVHRAATTALAGVPVFTCPSVFLPARPDHVAGPPITLVDGPVGLALHVPTSDGGIASHVRVTR